MSALLVLLVLVMVVGAGAALMLTDSLLESTKAGARLARFVDRWIGAES
ncbi:hypothetical protein [Aeromicrobium endophyticum]|nr:hypothetical protein [Aeromicrobium endophyticum]